MSVYWWYMFFSFPLIGLGLLVSGVNLLMKSRRRGREWCRTDAVVFELIDETLSGSGVVDLPRYKYQHNGEQFIGSSAPNIYKVGDKISVLVNPENPSESEHEGMYEILPYMILILGASFFVGGCVVSYWLLRSY